MKIFVLHDADIDGYNIARTLGEATRRMPDHNIDVIDLGLTVPQAIEYGLETEKFTRKKELPADLELDEDALEWFTGDTDTRRVTASSLRMPALRAERVLQRRARRVHRGRSATARRHHETRAPTGCAGRACAGGPRRGAHRAGLGRDRRMVDIDAVVRQLVADYPDLADVDEARIRDTFTDDPTQSWRSSAEQLVHEDIDAADGLADAVRAQLAEQLATPQDHEE